MKTKKILSAIAAAAVAFSAMAVCAISASAEGTYKAALTFQTAKYMFRDTFAQSRILVWDDEVGGAVDVEGASFSDAEITGNGQYTVSLTGIEDLGWRMLKLETNIDSVAAPDVTITIDNLKIGGADAEFTAPAMETYKAIKGSYDEYEFTAIDAAWKIQLINNYDTIANMADTVGDVEVTFTVAGLPETSAPAVDDTATADTDATTETAPTDTTAPAVTDEKGSPDTGVEGLAVVGGVAVLSAGALLIAKKRK